MGTLPLIALIASLAATAGGGIMSGIQKKKNDSLLRAQKSDLDSEYYEGALESAGAKAYLKRLDEIAGDNLQALDNGAVRTGATVENSLAAKNQQNEVTSNAINNLLGQEEQKKQGYFRDRLAISAQQQQNNSEAAQNWVQMAGNIANSVGTLGEAYLNDGAKMVNNEPSAVDTSSIGEKANADMANTSQNALDESIKNNSVQKPAEIKNRVELDEERKKKLGMGSGVQMA